MNNNSFTSRRISVVLISLLGIVISVVSAVWQSRQGSDISKEFFTVLPYGFLGASIAMIPISWVLHPILHDTSNSMVDVVPHTGIGAALYMQWQNTFLPWYLTHSDESNATILYIAAYLVLALSLWVISASLFSMLTGIDRTKSAGAMLFVSIVLTLLYPVYYMATTQSVTLGLATLLAVLIFVFFVIIVSIVYALRMTKEINRAP
ncbi:MAG: hypothetical protein AAB508_03240 [Patescibacteria group bacterium]|mgnify:CR=1 FL=1